MKKNVFYYAILAISIAILGFYFSNKSWSAIGLSLDLAGVTLLASFGLPSNYKTDCIINTEWDVRVDPEEKKKYESAKKWGE